MTNNIRQATQVDHNAIIMVAKTLPEWFDEFALGAEIPRDLDKYSTLVFEESDQIIGFINFTQENLAEIKWIGVTKNAHRRGIGTKLVQEAESVLKNLGFKELRVKTLSEDEDYEPYIATRAFYSKLGFSKIASEHIISRSGERLTMKVLKKDL